MTYPCDSDKSRCCLCIEKDVLGKPHLACCMCGRQALKTALWSNPITVPVVPFPEPTTWPWWQPPFYVRFGNDVTVPKNGTVWFATNTAGGSYQ